MLSLSDQMTVPQIFFNDDHIGGASELLYLLENWDSRKGFKWYYKANIESQKSPTDDRLRLDGSLSNLNISDGDFQYVSPTRKFPEDDTMDECVFGCFALPDGTTKSVRELTAELVEFMPRQKLAFYAKFYVNCFPGREGVDAFMKHYPGLESRKDAVAFGLALQKVGVLHHVCDDHPFVDTPNLYYRLQPFHEPHVLNSFKKSYRCYPALVTTPSIVPDPMALIAKLKKMIGTIEEHSVTPEGIDYCKARENPGFLEFEETSCELQCVVMEDMDDHTKLAFGINVYNVMIKHAYIKVGIPESNAVRGGFFGGVCYNVGGHTLSFDDLEHGILRANTRHPYHFKPEFSKDDPRLAMKVSQLDPRVHFALNCGAKSCPPISRYTVEAIEEELRIAALSFCEQEEHVLLNEEKGEMSLSMLFKWYRTDFCSSLKQLPSAMLPFLRGNKKQVLQRMLDSKKAIKVKYLTYDWGSASINHISFEPSSLTGSQASLRAAFRKQASKKLPKSDILASQNLEENAADMAAMTLDYY